MSTPTVDNDAVAARQAASKRVFDAEAALRIAIQTDVDSWVRAAAEKLHQAVVDLEAADACLGCYWSHAA